MKFLHYDLDIGPDHIVEVTLDKQANVRLLDDANFHSYRRGGAHKYLGGLAERSPVRLQAPSMGHWHLVIDLGGYTGAVRASVRVIER